MHEVEVFTDAAPVLGVVLDGRKQNTSLTMKRVWRLRRALRAVLRRGRISGQALEVLIGHATYCAMIERALMSCLHAT